jgi:hypothetical protein
MCGQRLALGDARNARSGLTMTVSVTKITSDTGPALKVSFTSVTTTQVSSSPPSLFEVLYLREGMIVGGGPLLNQPGDDSLQGLNLEGDGFMLSAGQPSIHELGPRNTLCASLSWSQMWTDPRSVEVLVLQGEVTGKPPEISIGTPSLASPLLVARANLQS